MLEADTAVKWYIFQGSAAPVRVAKLTSINIWGFQEKIENAIHVGVQNLTAVGAGHNWCLEKLRKNIADIPNFFLKKTRRNRSGNTLAAMSTRHPTYIL